MSCTGLRVSGGLGAYVLRFWLCGFRALRLFTAVEGDGFGIKLLKCNSFSQDLKRFAG